MTGVGVAPSKPFEFIVLRVGRTDNEFEITEQGLAGGIAVMALLSATGVRADPLLNHNFIVSLIDSSSTLETEEL